MPKYITESGYEEFEDVRTRVGRNDPVPQRLWLVKVGDATVRELKFDTLPGINVDPLAAMRKAAGKDALKGPRDVQVLTSGDNSGGPSIRWTTDGRQAAVMVRAIDNKDRWIASIDLPNAKLQSRHRLTDPAWINWTFNDFGFAARWRAVVPLRRKRLVAPVRRPRATARRARSPRASGKSRSRSCRRTAAASCFLCNRAWPGDYEVCEVDRDGGAVREITALDGVEDFVGVAGRIEAARAPLRQLRAAATGGGRPQRRRPGAN